MKWLALLFWNPVEALDLRDRQGQIDHAKVIGFVTFMVMSGICFIGVMRWGELLPLGHLIALVSTAYGWAGWRTFLAAKRNDG